jgi:hypothetical protein
MSTLEEKRANRLKFMRSLYEATGGRSLQMVNMFDLGPQVGIVGEDLEGVTEYLVGEGLMEYAALGGEISITHRGVVEVEESMANPDEPTAHFPPINLISIGVMSNSQIQQGSPAAVQAGQWQTSGDDIRAFVSELRRTRDQLGLDEDGIHDLETQLTAIEKQAASDSPRWERIRSGLLVIQEILTTAAGTALAQVLLGQLRNLLGPAR